MESPNLDFLKIFEEVCLGNISAFEFCASFLAWVHLIDDTIDGDRPRDAEMVIKLNLQAAMVFAFNPFWLQHKASLLPLVIQGVKAFTDSIDWAQRTGARDRQASDVIKAQYQEVFWHVAYLTGGYDHLDKITRKHRDYHYDVT